MISIVIPAYNEEAVIARCLRALTARPVAGGLEVIVACNGCRDRTAEIAHSFGEPVRVVETEKASKIAALNLGDQAATGFPRVFLDADVEVSLDTIEKVAALLRDSDVMAAAPKMKVDTTGASLLVKAFYAIWLRQPYHGQGMVGGGFYAISEKARAKFDQFPLIIADDEFIRALYPPEQRATADCTFTIRSPRKLSDLIRIKTRSRLGLYELRSRMPHLAENSRHKADPWWKAVLTRPQLWPAAVVYLFVNVITRLRAKKQLKTIDNYQWERDESSRQAVHPPA